MAAIQSRSTDSLTAILFAVFAVACLGAFLSYRGSDIGQLPKLVGNLGGGPLFGSDVTQTVAGAVVGLIVYLAWYGLGSTLLRLWPAETSVTSGWAYFGLCAGLGAAAWSLILFFIGITGLYLPLVAAIVLLAGAALHTLVNIKYPRPVFRDSERPVNASERALIGIVVLTVVVAFVAALAPPIAKDTLLYHFSVPNAFAVQQSNSFISGNIASFLPLGAEMQVLWARLLGWYFGPRAVETAGSISIFMFFPPLLLAVYGWARQLGITRTWALTATVIVVSVPTAFHVVSSGYIDIALALFVTLAVYSLTRWWKEQTWGWAVLIGVYLGAALSVKLTAVFVVAAFALMILLRARGGKNTRAGILRPGRALATGPAALVLAGVIASPWYIRTWVATGSPVFPFYMSICPGKADGWDVERSNLFQAMNSQYGGIDTDKLNLVTAPVRASIAAQPEQAEYYDGVLGVAFLIGLPVLIWALWKFDMAVEVKIATAVAGIMYLFWLFSSEQLRYLLPILPLFAIAIAASAEAVTKTRKSLGKVLQYSLVAACLCAMLTSIAWFCQMAPLRVVLGGETRDEYLARNLDYYPYYQWINSETPADTRVWLINMRRDTYNIDRPVLSDYLFEDWTLRKLVWGSRNVDELRSKAASMNVQYVLARHDFLFDYDRSTLVDDKLPRGENQAKIDMAKQFLLDPQRTVKADSKFSLVKVL